MGTPNTNTEKKKFDIITVDAATVASATPEHKAVDFKDVKEVKSITTVNGEKMDVFTFTGYGAVYNNIDYGGDIIEPDAFEESLKVRAPACLWEHKDDEPVGVYKDIKSDSFGLDVTGQMPKDDTFVTGRIIPQIKIGSVRGLSVGYITEKYFYDENDNRHIVQAILLEISLTGAPMNNHTTITGFKSKSKNRKEKEKSNEVEVETKSMAAFNKYSSETGKILSDILADVRVTKFLME